MGENKRKIIRDFITSAFNYGYRDVPLREMKQR